MKKFDFKFSVYSKDGKLFHEVFSSYSDFKECYLLFDILKDLCDSYKDFVSNYHCIIYYEDLCVFDYDTLKI